MQPWFVRMFEHLVWADGQATAALLARPDREAVALYAHVIGAEHVWLERIAGTPPTAAVWPDPDLDACAALAAENHRRLRALAAGADEAALGREVTYTTSDGRTFTSSVGDILIHVALHGQHHRAQIATRLRITGARPPSLDYIAWARGGAAATRQ